MKKSLLLLLMFSLLTGIFALALNESFESLDCPAEGWTLVYGNASPPSGNLMTHSTTYAHTGTRSFRFSSYSSGAPYDQYLITPPIEVTESNRSVSFYYRRHTSGSEIFRVGWSSTGTDPNDFTWTEDITNASASWQQYEKTDLPLDTRYVAIHYKSNYEYYLYIDDFVGPDVYFLPEPPLPCNLVSPASGATGIPTSPQFKWTTAWGATGYKLSLWRESPFEFVLNQTDMGDSTSHRLAGELEFSTEYKWSVTPYNDYGNGAPTPDWSFTTMTDIVVRDFPFNEGFETGNTDGELINNWIQESEAPYKEWTANSASTDHNRTPRSGDFNATLLYGGKSRLMRPFELEGGKGYKIELYARQDGNNPNNAKIGIYWTQLPGDVYYPLTEHGLVDGDYQQVSALFTPDTDGIYWFVILGEINSTPWYISLDYISVKELSDNPVISFGFESVDFGDVMQGTFYSSGLLRIYNDGGGVLNLEEVVLDTIGDDADMFFPEPGSLEGALFAGQYKEFEILLVPTREGLLSAALKISYAGEDYFIPLSANALPAGTVMIELGDGTIDKKLPVNAYYGYSYSQSIYFQSDIDMSDKRIKKIAYYWNGAGAAPNSNEWVVYMGHTDKYVFSSTSDWIPLNQLTQVYAGTVNIPAAEGWIDIVLDAPFIYNNTDNLVIAVDENKSGYDSESYFFYNTNTPEQNRSLRSYSDSVNMDPANPTAGGSSIMVAAYPNIRMLLVDLPTNPVLTYNPTSVDYGEVMQGTDSSSGFLRIYNDGGGFLNLEEVDLDIIGDDADMFFLEPSLLEGRLSAGQYTEFEILLMPIRGGLLSATLKISYAGEDYFIPLSANALPTGVVIIGKGDLNNFMPVYTYYNYTYSQSIYWQQDLDPTYTSGQRRIDKIAWYWSGDDAGSNSNLWDVYLGHKSENEFDSANDWVPLSELSLVYSGVVDITNSPGWVEIELDMPFVYNNTDNLVIAVDENKPGYDSGSRYFYCSESYYDVSLRNYADSDNPDPASPPSGTLVNGYPNIKLHTSEIPIYPEISVVPTDVDFGTVMINSDNARSITVSNIGGGVLTINTITATGIDFMLDIAHLAFPVSLGTGDYLRFNINYNPATAGLHEAVIDIDYATAMAHVNVQGVCVDPTISSFTHVEEFDDPWIGEPAAPFGWQVIDADNDNITWKQDNQYTPPISGFYVAHGSGNKDDYLISPPIDLTGKNLRLRWWDFAESSSYPSSYKVYVSTTSNPFVAAMTELGDYLCANTIWIMHEIDLSDYRDQVIYIVIHQYDSGPTYYGFGIEDFTLEEIPSDPIPSLSVLDIDFDIHYVNTVSDFEIFEVANVGVGTLELTASMFQIIGADASQFQLYPMNLPYSLLSDQSVAIHVRYQPTTSGNHTATLRLMYDGINYDIALSGYGIVPGLLYEGFEMSVFPPLGWESDGWAQDASRFHSGEYSAAAGRQLGDEWLVTPQLSVSSEFHTLMFWYRNDWIVEKGMDAKGGDRASLYASTANSQRETAGEFFEVLVSTQTSAPADFSPISVWSLAQGEIEFDWRKAVADLSAYTGQNIYIAFKCQDVDLLLLMIDDVIGPMVVPNVPQAPTLTEPLNNAIMVKRKPVLRWDPATTGGIPSVYKVYMNTFNPPTTQIGEAYDHDFAIQNVLQPETTYYWRVESYNDAGSALSEVFKFTTFAHGVVQVGDGKTRPGMPVVPNYNYSYSQSLYYPAELQYEQSDDSMREVMPDPRPITKIAYQWNGEGTGQNSNYWTVYMGHTNMDDMWWGTWMLPPDIKPVFKGTVNITATPGWVEIPLQRTFMYNDRDNLVIAVLESKPGSDTPHEYFYGHDTDEITSRSISSDYALPDVNNPTGGAAAAWRPNAMFTFEDLSPNQLPIVNVPSDLYFIRNSTFDVNFGQYIADPDTPASQLSIEIESIAGIERINYQYLPVNEADTPGQFVVRFSSGYQFAHTQGFRIIVRDHITNYVVTADFNVNLLEHFEVAFDTDGVFEFTGQTVLFKDLTLGNPNHWFWEFGDGQISTLRHPNHIYADAGIYSVKLTLGNNEADEEASLIIPSFITMRGTAVDDDNLPPDWDLEGSPYNFYDEVVIEEDIEIDPDVEMNFFSQQPLIIQGRMNANNVTFQPGDDGGTWRGIRFGGQRNLENSVLENCNFKNAILAIEIENASPQLTGVTFTMEQTRQETENLAILIRGSSSSILSDLEIENYTNGIRIVTPADGQRSTPTLGNIRIRNSSNTSRDSSTGIRIAGHANLDDVEVDGFDTGIHLDGEEYASTPTLGNIRIRNSTNTSRNGKTGIKITGNSDAELDDVEIWDVNYGVVIDGEEYASTPTLGNIRIRNSSNTSRDSSAGLRISGGAQFSDVEIDDFDTGVIIDGSEHASTPTLGNIRIRNSSNTSRNGSTGIRIAGGADFDDVEIDGFDTGVVIDGEEYATTPTLGNIRIRNSSNTSRNGKVGFKILNGAAPIMDDVDIEDVSGGILIDGTGSPQFRASTPTLGNIRIRNSSNTSRDPSWGIEIKEYQAVILDDVELDDFDKGIIISAFDRAASTPTLGNIRIRNSSNTSRDLNTALEINGSVAANIDDLEISGYDNGIKYDGSTGFRATATPTLSNIRIRNSSNTSREVNPDPMTGLSIHNVPRIECDDIEIEGYQIGLEISAFDRAASTPTLGNIRIRNSSNTSRMEDIGILLGDGVGGTLKNAKIEGAKTGIYVSEENSTRMDPFRIFNCETGIKILSAEQPKLLKNNLFVVESAFMATVPGWQFKAIKLGVPGAWTIRNNTISGYDTFVKAENAQINFINNIAMAWAFPNNAFDLANSQLDATYNDMNPSGPVQGVGNINQPPLFVNAAERNFKLTHDSPCIDAGSPHLPLDADGTVSDIGAYPYLHQASMQVSQRFVTPGTTVTFTNTSMGHDKPYSSIEWDLGKDDVIESSDPIWNHQFNEIGVYDIRLTMRTGTLEDIRDYDAVVVVQDPAITAPQELTIALDHQDIILNWQPVTLSQGGAPVNVEYYIVYSSKDPKGYFDYVGYTTGFETQYTHIDGANAQRKFYFVVGYNGSLRGLQDFIEQNRSYKLPTAETGQMRSKP